MKYEVWFELINEEKTVDFRDRVYTDAIERAIREFNQKGAVARNKKQIYDKEIQKTRLKIFFESDDVLEKPTKSFRHFSGDLIDGSDAFRSLAVGRKLLKGVYAKTVSEQTDTGLKEDISDEQMLVTLIHWCMGKEVESAEDKKNKQLTIGKIKALLTEHAMLSQ